MMRLAQQVAASLGGFPIMLGPAVSDIRGSSRLRTDKKVFVDSLLSRLEVLGALNLPSVCWSQHNYDDVTYDRGPGSPTGNIELGTLDTRARLTSHGWRGWPTQNAADPRMLLTEGGVTLQDVMAKYGQGGSLTTDRGGNVPPISQSQYLAKQAALLERAWNRMRTNTEGAGVGMMTNYLFWTDPNYDSGLVDSPTNSPPNGAIRPAYNTWKSLVP